MDEFKGRWQAQQSEDAGSRLVGGTLARSVAECFMAGYQLALDRTFYLQDTRWGALAVSEGFEGHPPVTVDGESALAGSKTWVCLLYTSPSPRDLSTSRMPSSA